MSGKTGRIVRRAAAGAVCAVVGLYLLLMLLPLLSLLQFSGFWRIFSVMGQDHGWDAVRISLGTTAVTAALMLLIGTPVAFVLSRWRARRIARVASLLCELPIALPPSVAGIALLLLFGQKGIVGHALAAVGVQTVFTPVAVVIAQFFVSCPLYIQIVRTAADQVNQELYEAAYVGGADHMRAVVRYIIPMLRPAIVSGLTVGYIRAFGEFGATLLFAGNMQGITTTMPLQIYTLMESDVRLAAAFSIVLICMAATIAAFLRGVLGREKA